MNSSFYKKPLAAGALLCTTVLIGIIIFGPLFTPHKPDEIDVEKRLLPPNTEHILGTDQLGRDLFTRLIYGARVSLGAVGVIIICVSVISVVVGCVAGYCGGIVDTVLMRLCDIFMTFPTFILAMFLIGILGTGLTNVIIAIVLTHWAWYCRIIRSIVLSLKNQDYITASRVAGTNHFHLIIRHFLPPIVTQLVVLASMDIGHMILHVSGLSFLGLGIQPPIPEWGVMINDGRQFIRNCPQLILLPGLMILFSVMSFNLLGDMIRDSLDPVLKQKGEA